MVVVCIQVAGVAGTFPYLAESIFPQTPYFNKDIGDLQGIRHVHVPISIFLTGMQTLRGQRVDFRLHILHLHRRDKHLLYCTDKCHLLKFLRNLNFLFRVLSALHRKG